MLDSGQHSDFHLLDPVDAYHERIVVPGLQQSGRRHDPAELRKLEVEFDAAQGRIKVLHREQRVAVGRSKNQREGRERETGERHLRELYRPNGDGRIMSRKIYKRDIG